MQYVTVLRVNISVGIGANNSLHQRFTEGFNMLQER
jgi:hypothetical protein